VCVILLKEINSTAAGSFLLVSLWPVCSSDSIDFFSPPYSCFRLRGACDEWLEVLERSGMRERDFSFPLCSNASSTHTLLSFGGIDAGMIGSCDKLFHTGCL